MVNPIMLNEINKAEQYNKGKFEVIDVIEDWDLGFHLGNVIKYIARHKHKGTPLKDLEKANYYLKRKINESKENNKKTTM